MKFQCFNPQDCAQILSLRSGETKLGQKLQFVSSLEEIEHSSAKYVILGTGEDAGVKLNQGIGGAQTSWQSFLKAWVNIQVHPEMKPEHILIAGAWQPEAEESVQEVVSYLDHVLTEVVTRIVSWGKVPIIIGGGHNNAYGAIRGAASALGKAIGVINCDPHADLRATDTRHSGNGFSFALQEGYLHKYFILGMHQAYNNVYIRNLMGENEQLSCLWYEDIFWKQSISWEGAIEQARNFVGAPYGLELDMDSIEHVLTSAMTPMGISAQQAGMYVYQLANQACYFHLAEGVYQREDGQVWPMIGKLQSYLVQAFIKGHQRI